MKKVVEAGLEGMILTASRLLFSQIEDMRHQCLAFVCTMGIVCNNCMAPDHNEITYQRMFTKVSSDWSGIDFTNTINENDSLNIILYEYMYNGGGVAVGDINNDGLSDLIFSGNQVSSRLYLNKGELQFEDITDIARLQTTGWCTGVSMVDINADGLLDIYICKANKELQNKNPENLLFINKGNNQNGYPVFSESAAAYGLNDTPSATQATFFDYDLDGDLDLYLLIHEYDDFNSNRIRPRRLDGSAPNTDRLYRNEGIKNGHPYFMDVSREAGIQIEGYGLGIAVSDFNLDLFPDIYIANDYNSNDILYVNNGDGTFTNKISEWIRHQSNSSMGCDVSDFNNDGLVDIITLDMLPRDNKRQKLMIGTVNNNRFQMQERYGYEPQYMRNMLQLNNGMDPQGNPFFSEIGQLAGIHQTGWSWSPLWADLNNDGWKDLFVTNGIPKDLTNLDLINYRQSRFKNGARNVEAYINDVTEYMNSLQALQERNYIFQNTQNLSFSDQTVNWGISDVGSSNGAVYADLDNDGDLELVINNINEKAVVYQNNLRSESDDLGDYNFLNVKTKGKEPNIDGIGATVSLFNDGKEQYLEQNPYRGFQSSIDRVLHFGLDSINTIDSLEVRWPLGKRQVIRNLQVNQLIVLDEQEAKIEKVEMENPLPLFKEVSKNLNIEFRHKEKFYDDFSVSPLLPQKYSYLGPGIAVGDVNGDDLEDFFIGGAYKQSGSFYIQMDNGVFQPRPLTSGEKKEEDMGCLLFDADNDEDLDLYVVSGSSEYGPTSKYYQDRLYTNDGNGNFKYNPDLLPDINVSGSCVIAADFDRDGDLDIFRGSRVALTTYPQPVNSYLFVNEKGKLVNATNDIAPDMNPAGLVSGAIWSDVNNDQWPDLIIVGEWMPITIFQNEHGFLTKKITLSKKGWWNAITGGDFDNDGDVDYIVGNLGENSPYNASDEHPLSITTEDFNNDSLVDGIISAYLLDEQGNKLQYPVHPRNTLTSQLNGLKHVFQDYRSYATVTTPELYAKLPTKVIKTLECNELRTIYLENLGEFQFEATPLPLQAQLGPVFGLLSYDIDGDTNLDLVLTGNSYSTEVLTGQYDAINGSVILGNGKGSFKPLDTQKSGFYVDGDAKGLAYLMDNAQGLVLLAARNDGTLKAFSPKASIYRSLIPERDDIWGELYFKNGKKRKVEFYQGSSYLSQSSLAIPINSAVTRVVLYDRTSKSRITEF